MASSFTTWNIKPFNLTGFSGLPLATSFPEDPMTSRGNRLLPADGPFTNGTTVTALKSKALPAFTSTSDVSTTFHCELAVNVKMSFVLSSAMAATVDAATAK
ncbi:MAG TPA: hypothetical protein PLM14_09555 [Candidatus Hydrogenedentes bacterium]|nr:hypothetical protein [Candidatus Hydrogenedentota bacterium]HQH53361.1 hypothetical protein [Candidatus Hydrogenedentota bacterium]